MGYDPNKHHRRSIRLKGYDYTSPGSYFVTICTQDHACTFGEVVDGDMHLNPYGRVVDTYWSRIPRYFPHVMLDTWVVMPNHIHGIIVITDAPALEGDESPPVDERGHGCRGEAILESPPATGHDSESASSFISLGQMGIASPLPESPPATGHDSESKPSSTSMDPAGIASPLQTSLSRQTSRHPTPPSRPHGVPSGSLGAIVGNVKSITARRINRMKHTPGGRVWQRNYWEHIICDERVYQRICQYIEDNPALWEEDQLHPDAPPNPFNRG